MDAFIGQFGQYGELILALMGVCAAVAALMPAPDGKSGKAYRIFYRILNFVAVNVAHARNAGDNANEVKR